MPQLVDNILEGLANATGAERTASRLGEERKHRQQLSDEALEDTIQSHVDVMKGLQARLGQNPNDPQLLQQLGSERDQLYKLLHSSEQTKPGLVQKLFRHVFRQKGEKPQPVNNLPSVEMMAAAAPQQPDKFKEFQKLYKEATGKDLPSDEAAKWAKKQGGIEDKPEKTKYKREDGTDASGNPMTIYREEGDPSHAVNSAGQDIPEDVLAGWKPAAKDKPETATQVSLEAYGDAYDPPVAWKDMTPQQKAYYPTWKAMQTQATTTGDRVVIVTQKNGDQVPVVVRGVTSKTIAGGGTPAPAGLRGRKKSKPAGEQRKDLHKLKGKFTKTGAGVISQGAPVGHKNTAAQNKAQTEYDGAVDLDTVAKLVEAKPDDASNVKGFAIALERARAGRFTTQALDVMLDAGWGNKLEQWARKPESGTLPRDVLRQLVEGAHNNLAGKKAALDAAFAGSQSGSDNSGITDDEIIKALNGAK